MHPIPPIPPIRWIRRIHDLIFRFCFTLDVTSPAPVSWQCHLPDMLWGDVESFQMRDLWSR